MSSDSTGGLIGCLAVLLYLAVFGVVYWLADTQLGFFGFVWQILLVAVAITLLLALLIASVIAIAYYLFRACEAVNRQQAVYFKHADKAQYDEFHQQFQTPLVVFIIVASVLSTLGIFILRGGFGVSLFAALAVTVGLSLVMFYGRMIATYRHLGKWSYYDARRLTIPYLIASAIAIALAALAVYVYLYGAVHGMDSTGALNVYSYGFDEELRRAFATSPLYIDWTQALQALGWSAGIAILIVWFVPLIYKRDVVAIALNVLVVATPFISQYASDWYAPVQVRLQALLDYVPAPLLAIGLAVVLDRLIGLIRGTAQARITCQCGNEMVAPKVFCWACGEPVTSP